MDNNKKKLMVGIFAIIATIITGILWIFKSKGRRKIASWIVILSAIISIGLWIWYFNLPSFQDTNKSFSQIEQRFSLIKKGDLK